MAKLYVSLVICLLCVLSLVSVVLAAPLLNANEIGFNGQTRDNNYDTLIDSYFSNSNVVTSINNNLLWVPWFKTSSSSQISDLQDGANCNSGQTIDFTHNCMVTDEFSQIGILVSMGKDQSRMDQFYNTVVAAKSTYGNLPSWRIYRNDNTIEACKQGINTNCDTASDGTARIIIALFTASKNSYMTNTIQKANYATLAKKLADDMLTYEVDNTCRQTNFGNVCYWLAGGSNVKTAGITASNFAYTGYYPDAIIAMLETYANTNDIKYYNVARDFTLNYLQAANFNNQTFSAPPGKSFKWTTDSNGIPQAQCTDTCSPVLWDGFDASRALGMCQANYYAKQMNIQLPYLQNYCDLLSQKYTSNPNSAPIQFYPDGTAAGSQSGYYAQGLEALHQSGGNPNLFKATLDSALSHYSVSTKTFDYASSIGVYTTAFAVRALGMGIGRDVDAFKLNSTAPTSAYTTTTTTITPKLVNLIPYCSYGATNTPAGIMNDISSGSCRTIVFNTPSGIIKIFACEKNNGYVEIYKLAAPSGIAYKACLANGCITKDNGFARFQPTAITTINVISTTTTSPTIIPNTITTQISKPSASAPITQLQTMITPITYDITNIPITIQPSGTLVTDIMDGATCRKVQYNTPYGWNEAKICAKDTSTYEMYLLSAPNAASICVGNNCVGQNSGFASFTY